MDVINDIDKKIDFNQDQLSDLKSKKVVLLNDIASLKKEDKEKIESQLKKLDTLENKISIKDTELKNLKEEKDTIIKKCLMNLHTKMKKDYKKVNEDHDQYVELYTQAREERHSIERKMMNLKSLVYKNYKVRLI